MTNLTQPEQVDNSSASTTTAINSPAILVAPPNGSPADAELELEWKSSLRNLEHHMILYKSRAREGEAVEEDVEEVAKAMEEVADSHSDPKVKRHWRNKARAFRTADADERDGILEDIGKGFLTLLTTPFLLVGTVLQVAGGILNGVASILKGVGKLTGKLAYRGSSKT